MIAARLPDVSVVWQGDNALVMSLAFACTVLVCVVLRLMLG